ncbi:uncharacterized protein AAEQ78_002743 [Lycaon pictus]
MVGAGRGARLTPSSGPGARRPPSTPGRGAARRRARGPRAEAARPGRAARPGSHPSPSHALRPPPAARGEPGPPRPAPPAAPVPFPIAPPRRPLYPSPFGPRGLGGGRPQSGTLLRREEAGPGDGARDPGLGARIRGGGSRALLGVACAAVAPSLPGLLGLPGGASPPVASSPVACPAPPSACLRPRIGEGPECRKALRRMTVTGQTASARREDSLSLSLGRKKEGCGSERCQQHRWLRSQEASCKPECWAWEEPIVLGLQACDSYSCC